MPPRKAEKPENLFRTCIRCGESTPETELVPDKKAKYGFRNLCKNCFNAGQKQRYHANGYWHENRQQRQRTYLWNKKYSLSAKDYEALLHSQNGRCAICGTDSPSRGRDIKFHVDHCHSTGVVRGLLCNECNTGLGKFKDNIDILLEAAGYLERHASAKRAIKS